MMRGHADFAALITDIAELVVCGVALWLGVATLLVVWGARRGATSVPARLAARVTPRAWRRVLALVLGGAIALAPAASSASSASDSPATVPDVTGLRLPDRPSVGLGPSTREPTARPSGGVIVRTGDTLWDIAAESLPAHASDAARARACRRWYDTNRDVIGDDPDLLLPGMRLTPPREHPERTDR